MTDLALHLTERVMPFVPVRQLVLSLPPRVRYLLAYDHARCSAVLRASSAGSGARASSMPTHPTTSPTKRLCSPAPTPLRSRERARSSARSRPCAASATPSARDRVPCTPCRRTTRASTSTRASASPPSTPPTATRSSASCATAPARRSQTTVFDSAPTAASA
jgi:hypothetical protein